MTDTRLKIAVFIDFDNIEIGVKTTLNQAFDIGVVLEAVKERGEVVTKVAYSDWKRAGDYSRQLSHHAIRMVQRNLTPGGDKNGADINLALDALEMAFTHDHINAFVIVGGDSDFITLVEKLKQYDKKVFVVGGRQFTSLVMQKNCHEFIAYENLVGTRRSGGTGRARTSGTPAAIELEKALPLVKRALKVLSDREVTPQLGLLKSTLLQLDSTFSERDYGASTFRDFIEKVAERGIVTLKQAGRSVLVELADQALPDRSDVTIEPASAVGDMHGAEGGLGESVEPREGGGEERQPEPIVQRPQLSSAQATEAVQVAAQLLARATQPPRWPMYIRQIRQYLRNADETFDERKLGFTGIVEFLRACQREGLLRLERDRQGVMRVFAGASFPRQSALAPQADVEESRGAAVAEGGDDSQPGLDTSQAGANIDTRFRRVTDLGEPEPAAPSGENATIDSPTDASAEEDLSVGPGNVAGRETHTIMTTPSKPTRRPVRKGVVRTPRKPAGPLTARAPRAPRGRKTTKA